MGDTACDTFKTQQLYRLKSDEQRVNILAQQKDLDSTNIADYVNAVQDIQAQLIRIDPQCTHHETLAPAFMTRLLNNLNAYQQDEMFWLQDKWKSRTSATNLDYFTVGEQLITKLEGKQLQAAKATQIGDIESKGGAPIKQMIDGFYSGEV